jgi:heavy metal sensor kinase
MNPRSIRFRLTIWYLLAFFISTALAFTAFYYITEQTLMAQTDKEVTLHAQRIVQVVAQGAGVIGAVFPKDKLSHEFAEMPGMLVAIADKNGAMLTSSQPVESGAEVLKDIFAASVNSKNPTFHPGIIGTTHMRLGVFPVVKDATVINLVVVGHPIDVIQASLNRLVERLAGVLLLMALLTSVGGFFIAKGGLQPITAFSAKLRKISSANMTEQIDHPKTGDELEELADSFNTLLARLAGSFERERQFIGDMAHELKTPLATLRNTLEVTLSRQRTSENYQETFSEMLVDVNSLSATINDVLDLAWSESDRPLAESEVIDLTEVVAEVDELAQRMAEEKAIRVIEEIQPEITIKGKRQKIFRVLFNIIDNAVKYTPAQGRMAITLGRTGNEAVIEISNTGPGIQAEDLPHVFDRFYRSANASSTMGSGLGLAICQAIIEAHQGRISIHSDIDKLTTIKIALPLA